MSRYTFRLPDIGEGVVEGEIVAWHVKPGDDVNEDQALVDVMTDKATVTIPSVVGGKVVSTRGKVGEIVAVGSELVVMETSADAAVLMEKESPAAASKPAAKSGAASTAATSSVATQTRPVATAPSAAKNGERPLASPAVRRRAREKGVDLDRVSGTGRGGRITDADVEKFLHAGATSTDGRAREKRTGTTEIPVAGLRRLIAQKMSLSASHIPHFTYIDEVDVTELASLRNYLNEKRTADQPKLTFLPFIMVALVKALQKHPESNAHYDEEREVVTRHEAVHFGIATQTERGLYVPVVRHVETMDVWQAASELKRVSRAAHDNTIRREELVGSTFTITSLGALGGLAATPIINHPEVAILGIHRAEERAVVRGGHIVVRTMMNLSASFDHRIVDGADGASLVQTLKGYLEHPAAIFM